MKEGDSHSLSTHSRLFTNVDSMGLGGQQMSPTRSPPSDRGHAPLAKETVIPREDSPERLDHLTLQ